MSKFKSQKSKLLFILLFLIFEFYDLSFALSSSLPYFYSEEIIVTALRIPQKKADSPWDVTVIDQEKIKAYGLETVGDALRLVSGLDIYAAGGQGALVTARIKGSNASQVLILRDGCRINNPLLGTLDLGDILLNDVERIEVVSAPLSSVYGSDALSGVINIITKKNAKTSPLALGVSIGSVNLQKVDLSFGDESYIVSALYDKTNGFRQNSDYLARKLSISKQLKDFRLIAEYFDADKGVPGVPDSANNPYSASTPNNRQQDSNLNLSAVFENNLLSGQIYRYTTQQKYHEYNFLTTTFADYLYNTGQTGINLQSKSSFKDAVTLLYGLEYRLDNGESTNIGQQNTNNYAVYLSLQNNSGPIALDLGLRQDVHSKAGGALSPRLGVTLKPYEDLKFFTNVATAFRAPTLNELYWNDPIWNMFGNQNLKPETAVEIELGMSKYFSQTSSFDLVLFSRQIKDQILWEFNSTTFVTQARNVGATQVSGCELKNQLNIVPGLDMFLNATLQNAIDQEDTTATNVGKDIPYSPRTKANLGLNWKNQLGQMSFLTKYVGERYGDAANNTKLAEYTVVDLKIDRNINNFDVYAKINNLFNASYAEAIGYHPVTYAISEYPMPGRNFAFGVNYRL